MQPAIILKSRQCQHVLCEVTQLLLFMAQRSPVGLDLDLDMDLDLDLMIMLRPTTFGRTPLDE